MATNPFEDEDGRYYALINDEGQYSLWPVFAEVPAGWTIAHTEDSRQACLTFIEENWTDMRPNSLIREMEEYEKQKKQGAEQKEEEPEKAG
jgi:MbtH protein